ncbi:Alpha/Beta hydrolase protein [Aspergillus pseudoustus]|uniref:Alpha/Beta hydrolase protein n=1 Tax=Aspergillus pseudoustus TaxID=1810923 RepID=A0ABR4IB64_9EURO
MVLTADAILAGTFPDPKFEEILAQGDSPLFPSDIDIATLRVKTNEAKSKARSVQGPHPDITEQDITIPTRDGGSILTRVYYPTLPAAGGSTALPVFLFFHGGGFCIGSRFDDFEANRAIALRNRVVVISPEYRLAPEHPFPTAVYDGLDTLQWIATNVRLIHPSASIAAGLIIGGTSAGGNIASAVLYLNRDQENVIPVTGQFLSVAPLLPSPVVPEKYREAYRSAEGSWAYDIPPPEMVHSFLSAYKPDIHSPLMVPFNHAKGHADIPPTYFQVCGLDALRDETLIYEQVLREENSILTRLDYYPGLPHHFWEFFPQLTKHVKRRTDDTVEGFKWLLEARLEMRSR